MSVPLAGVTVTNYMVDKQQKFKSRIFFQRLYRLLNMQRRPVNERWGRR